MSYILDALKKSEQQKRERDGVQAVDMTPLLMTAAPAEAPRLPIGLIAAGFAMVALVLAVGAWLWWPKPAPDSIQPVAEAPSSSALNKTTETTKPAVADSAEAETGAGEKQDVTPEPKADPDKPAVVLNTPPKPAYITAVPEVATPPKAVVAAVAPKPVAAVVTEPVAPAPITRTPQQPNSVDAAETSSKRPSVERRVLPPLNSLRKIPDLIISSHIYAENTDSRSVNMNGRNWYEGELISPGVVLDKITETGILLDVDGFPFPVHRNNGWQSIVD